MEMSGWLASASMSVILAKDPPVTRLDALIKMQLSCPRVRSDHDSTDLHPIAHPVTTATALSRLPVVGFAWFTAGRRGRFF